ncbi:hypothetical protein B6U71_01595 [Euryarchaeota archaeon ex4484_178]|nr:MAG: hypothetical protein B6U71_01595 [Euryarchaeota archaeon ex4484_178]
MIFLIFLTLFVIRELSKDMDPNIKEKSLATYGYRNNYSDVSNNNQVSLPLLFHPPTWIP